MTFRAEYEHSIKTNVLYTYTESSFLHILQNYNCIFHSKIISAFDLFSDTCCKIYKSILPLDPHIRAFHIRVLGHSHFETFYGFHIGHLTGDKKSR